MFIVIGCELCLVDVMSLHEFILSIMNACKMSETDQHDYEKSQSTQRLRIRKKVKMEYIEGRKPWIEMKYIRLKPET